MIVGYDFRGQFSGAGKHRLKIAGAARQVGGSDSIQRARRWLAQPKLDLRISGLPAQFFIRLGLE